MAKPSLDAEYAKAVERLLAKLETSPQPEAGDVKSRRPNIDKLMRSILHQLPEHDDVEQILIGHGESHDGYQVPIYRFKQKVPTVSSPGPAIVYTHGGGYFCLSVEIYKPLLKYYASVSGVPVYAMEYRLPPEHPYPTPLEDCFSGLKFVHKNAAGLDVDPERIILMGDSAGGGLCAGTAILARDRGILVAKQLVIHGNLDDRNVKPGSLPELAEVATWSINDNITGWEAYLGSGHESQTDIPGSAAPSRQEDVRELAPLYLDVPALDILRDEGLEYASRLTKAGVPAEVHVFPGVPHGFELFAPNIAMAKMIMQYRVKAIKSV